MDFYFYYYYDGQVNYIDGEFIVQPLLLFIFIMSVWLEMEINHDNDRTLTLDVLGNRLFFKYSNRWSWGPFGFVSIMYPSSTHGRSVSKIA
jgi:hypothetical protein